MEKIKLLIVDDDPGIRRELITYFNDNENIEIIGEASNGIEAIDKCRKFLPEIVIMDIGMPIMNGLKASKVIRKEMPIIKILVFTVYNEIEYVNEFRKIGVSGYLLKGSMLEELTTAINSIKENREYFMSAVS